MLPHWTQDDFIVNGIKIHYYRTGRGDKGKPPMVLAHGYSDNGLCWLRVARELEADWDVILPDARAHGLSARVQPGEMVDHAADLAGLIEGLGLEKPVVGGHSMGAGTAALLEARFPGLARALILEDPGWRNPDPPSQEAQAEKKPPRDSFTEWLLGLNGKTLAEVEAKGRADTPTWAEIEWPAWAESKLQYDPAFLQTERAGRGWPEVARAIGCPTLLLTADPQKGAIVTPEIAQQAAALSGHIQVVKITGAGHNIRRENFPAYMQAVQQFLKTLTVPNSPPGYQPR